MSESNNTPGWIPDYEEDQPPKGKTEPYYPYPGENPGFMESDTVSDEVAEPAPGGLTADGEYVFLGEGEDQTLEQHKEKVNKEQEEDE